MTTDEIAQNFPGAADAVAWAESVMNQADGSGACAWDEMLAGGYSPPAVVRFAKYLAMFRGQVPTVEVVIHPASREAVRQMDDPDFLKYVMGRMGCM